jgi:hypothetical protein
MHQNYYDIDYPKSNREKVLDPRGDNSHYCKCDLNNVNDGQKCSICHRRSPKKRFKI